VRLRVSAERRGGVAGLLLELSGHLLAVHEILSRPEIRQLASYRERHRRCSEAYTWVRNKAGSRYWYWYLKCPQRRPSSVYLGSSPEAHRALAEAAGAVARVRRALADLGLGELAGQLAEAAGKLEKLEAAAPAEAAQHTASTPRRRRKTTEGSPSRANPAPQREDMRGDSGQDDVEAARAANTATASPEGNPTPESNTGETPERQKSTKKGRAAHTAQERTRLPATNKKPRKRRAPEPPGTPTPTPSQDQP
jgi:hypothetical protein